MTTCPRCGYPEVGPRVPSLLGPVRTGYGPIVATLSVCLPCAQVEAMEYAELGQVLPLERWAVND